MIKYSAIALVALATTAAGPVVSNHVAVKPPETAGVTRTFLQRHDLGIAGREAIQMRIALAPRVAFPDHRHPGEEIIYVLEGAFEYVVNGQPIIVRKGEVLFIPARTTHSARNVGRGNAVELATYIVEKGQPLLLPAR